MTYIEPFGGTMGLFKIVSKYYTPELVVYNDIKVYDESMILPDYDIKHNLDYVEVLDNYNYEDSFFYLDPPYIGKEKYYSNTFEDGISDHFRLFNELKKLKGKWLLSYQDPHLLREWYSDYNFDTYKGNSRYHLSEIIIKNY